MEGQGKMGRFKEITLEGKPYERGLNYGRSCKDEIIMSIANYKTLFYDRKQITWNQALDIVENYIPVTEEYNRDYIEEMHGMAKGAGVLFEEIMAINARTEILHTGLCCEREDCQECTAFMAAGSATADGGVIAGQTWDFAQLQRDATVIIHLKQGEGKPDILMFPEAGMIGGKGMNSAGISLTLNALKVSEVGDGLPLHVRMRSILDSSTIGAAYMRATHGEIASAANLIITHRDGVALDLEMDPDGVDVLLPENGVLVHTNHFIGPRMSLKHSHSVNGSTYIRMQRIKHLLCNRSDITIEYIKEVFCDHKGYPNSICSHPNMDEPENKRNCTNFALIMDLSNACAYLAEGNPCEASFRQLII